ncbi:MAG: ferrous iron transport protein A [Anaerolineales bacterium]
MTHTKITCAMCGHSFDPDQHATCEKCPLHAGCHLTRCPSCGYETVDPGKSRLAGWFSRLFSPSTGDVQPPQETTLAHAPPGCRARVKRFAQTTPPQRKAHLQAYGVVPGHTVHVLQHKPVTVIAVDHLELALENELAEAVFVSTMDGKEGVRDDR